MLENTFVNNVTENIQPTRTDLYSSNLSYRKQKIEQPWRYCFKKYVMSIKSSLFISEDVTFVFGNDIDEWNIQKSHIRNAIRKRNLYTS